jgi:hypothetical protein
MCVSALFSLGEIVPSSGTKSQKIDNEVFP